MKFEKIVMKNFRQYPDNIIDFTLPNGGRGITIFVARNGAGKTTLVNGFRWCLYGTEENLSGKDDSLPIVSLSQTENLKPGESCEVSVAIYAVDADGKEIIFKRKLTFRKMENGKMRPVSQDEQNSKDGSRFDIFRVIRGDTVQSENPIIELAEMMPENLEDYFFFDGERLEAYFDGSAVEKKIKDEVLRLCQIELLERAIKNLEYKKKGYLAELRDTNARTKEISNELAILNNALEAYNNKLRKSENDRDTAAKYEEEYNNRLRNINIDAVNTAQKRRDEVNKDLERIKKALTEAEISKNEYMIGMIPAVFSYKALLQMSRAVDKKVDSGEIPKDIKRNFLESLLANGKCICGTDISKDTQICVHCGQGENRTAIQNLLRNCDLISDIANELITENVRWRSIIDDIRGFKKRLRSDNIKIGKLARGYEEKTEKLREIAEEMKKFGETEENVKNWENKRRHYSGLKDDANQQIGMIKIEIASTQISISKKEEELRAEGRKDVKHKMLTKIVDFCVKGLEGMNKIKDEIMAEIRKELEENTKNNFLDLQSEKGEYIDIRIDDEYNVSVIHRLAGYNGLNSLSKGEKMLLAYAFMSALNKVSGFDTPIIIDTPLGRLDGQNRKNVAENLPSYLEGKQIIMLLTDTEYTDSFRELLLPRVGKEYSITFRPGESTSVICEYIR